MDDAASAFAGGGAGGVDDAGGADLAGALAVEKVGGVDAVEGEAVGGVALAVGPDGLVAEAGECAGAAGEFFVYARGLSSQAGEAAGGQRGGLDLGLVEDVAVGSVDGVHQGRGVDFDCLGFGAGFELGVDGGGSVALHGDVRGALNFEAFGGEGQGIGADGQVDKEVFAAGIGLDGAGKAGLLAQDGHVRAGNDTAGTVGYVAGDAAKGALGGRWGDTEDCDREQDEQPDRGWNVLLFGTKGRNQVMASRNRDFPTALEVLQDSWVMHRSTGEADQKKVRNGGCEWFSTMGPRCEKSAGLPLQYPRRRELQSKIYR